MPRVLAKQASASLILLAWRPIASGLLDFWQDRLVASREFLWVHCSSHEGLPPLLMLTFHWNPLSA
jgi:hypothetical protein